MKSVSMKGPLSSTVLLPDPFFDKDYGDFLLSMCFKVLAQALTALPALYFSVLPRLRSADSSVSDDQANFATHICEAEASGRHFEPCLDSELSNTIDDFLGAEDRSEVNFTFYGEAVQGPDISKRVPQKDISAWLALAKNKDDEDEDDDEEEEDDEEDDDDEAADEEDVGDEGEGEEEVEGHNGGGGEEEEEDDDEDENGKGDDEEDDEDAVEAEDDEDEDAPEDEDDDDEEDDDEETQEPPPKKRK